MAIHLTKTWVRIAVSLLAGGAASEMGHILTGDPNRPQESNFALLYALLFFIIISVILHFKATKKNKKASDIENIGKE